MTHRARAARHQPSWLLARPAGPYKNGSSDGRGPLVGCSLTTPTDDERLALLRVDLQLARRELERTTVELPDEPAEMEERLTEHLSKVEEELQALHKRIRDPEGSKQDGERLFQATGAEPWNRVRPGGGRRPWYGGRGKPARAASRLPGVLAVG
jgi:hypothetical protein